LSFNITVLFEGGKRLWARTSIAPGKRSVLRAGRQLVGVVAYCGRSPARSLMGRDRRGEARGSLVVRGAGVTGAEERATRLIIRMFLEHKKLNFKKLI